MTGGGSDVLRAPPALIAAAIPSRAQTATARQASASMPHPYSTTQSQRRPRSGSQRGRGAGAAAPSAGRAPARRFSRSLASRSDRLNDRPLTSLCCSPCLRHKPKARRSGASCSQTARNRRVACAASQAQRRRKPLSQRSAAQWSPSTGGGRIGRQHTALSNRGPYRPARRSTGTAGSGLRGTTRRLQQRRPQPVDVQSMSTPQTAH